MTEPLLHARQLYINGRATQKEIAQTVGVTERTLYNWIKQYEWEKLKQAAYAAPAIIADNLCSQLVEMQNAIAAREPGKRFPTPQEAEITRKLVNSIEKLKKYPSLAQSMQVLETFRRFVHPKDEKFARHLGTYADDFMEARARNGFFPYQMEYRVDQFAPTAPPCDEKTELEEREATVSKIKNETGATQIPNSKFHPELRKGTNSEFSLQNVDNSSAEIGHIKTSKTIDSKGFEPLSDPFPASEKIGNLYDNYRYNEIAEFRAGMDRPIFGESVMEKRPSYLQNQPRNQPCACGSSKKFKHCHGKQSS